MRKLIHSIAATAILTLPAYQAWGADATVTFPISGEQTAATATAPAATAGSQHVTDQPPAADQATAPSSQPTTGTQPATTGDATAGTTAQPAAAPPQGQPTPQDGAVAQPTEGEQSDQSQQSEEDNTQSSGPLTATDKIVDHFMELDTDKSDGVSFDEYMAMVQKRATDRFAAMDANGDGQVTAKEYRKFWKERKAQWYRLRR